VADFVDGSAMQGSAVNKRLRLVVGYTKGAIPEARRGNRGFLADHLAQASRPMGGTLLRRNRK
jgi:hypothetical protein